jgi:cytochrome c5
MLNRMVKASVIGLGLSVAAGIGLQAAGPRVAATKQTAAAQKPATATAPAAPLSRALVDKYCVTCHSERLKRGNLVLEKLDISQVGEHAETWEKVLRKVRAGAMPPTGMPRPTPADSTAFLDALQASLDGAASAAPNPGRQGIHRLNRVEYANAIRDLLALEVDGRELLPPDDSGFGFDNIADALSVSPGLLERYMTAAQKISRVAIGDPTMKAAASTYTLSFFELQEDRASNDLPFGSRGGTSVRHYFPLDGEYALQIRLQRHAVNLGGAIRGLDEVNRIDVRVDGELVKSFTIGGGKEEQDGDTRGPYTETEMERFADDPLNVRFPAKAGMRTVGVTFQRQLWLPEGVGMSRLPVASYGYSSARKSGVEFGKVEMAVENVEIRGPFNGVTPESTPSRKQIFVCRPATASDEEACAKRIVSRLARRAYRRPVTDADAQTLMALYRDGRAKGTFDTGVQWALERLLVDPRFLFRMEQDPSPAVADKPYRVSDLEMASRLSFFLWSSLPDDELIDVAARGTLKTPAVFEQQAPAAQRRGGAAGPACLPRVR